MIYNNSFAKRDIIQRITRDHKIDYLNRLFLKRNTYYRHLDKNASLFDEQDNNESLTERVYTIKKTIKISIDQWDFRYGADAFRYKDPDVHAEVEFDVLKPYFAKVLKSKNVQGDNFFSKAIRRISAGSFTTIRKIEKDLVYGEICWKKDLVWSCYFILICIN